MTVTDRLVEFRIIRDVDKNFLKALYRSTREYELSLSTMDDAEKERFIAQQFNAQTESYRASYIGAVHRIITLAGADIGRLIVNRADDHMRVIDLSLLPEYQGRGIGSDILRALMNEAHGGKVPIHMMALTHNPAVELYLKLGFKIMGEEKMRYKLSWYPDTFREV